MNPWPRAVAGNSCWPVWRAARNPCDVACVRQQGRDRPLSSFPPGPATPSRCGFPARSGSIRSGTIRTARPRSPCPRKETCSRRVRAPRNAGPGFAGRPDVDGSDHTSYPRPERSGLGGPGTSDLLGGGPMRVLVAGDRGYLGAVIVPFLQQAGHDVVGLDAGWYDGCDFGPPPSGYEQRTGDIRDVHPDELAGLDAVVNLAAVSNDPVGDLNPEATYSVNADGAIHLGRMAKAAGVPRYVFSSSCSLYGAAADRRAVRRGRAVQPSDAVRREQGAGRGRAIGAGRRRLQPHLSEKRDGVRILSPAAGRHRRQQPHRHRRSPAARSGCRATAARGDRWCMPRTSHARSSLFSRRRATVVHNQAFNVGRDEDVVQIRDIATLVADALDAPVTFAAGAGPDKRDYRVDFTKIRQIAFPPSNRSGPSRTGSTSSPGTCDGSAFPAEDFEGPRYVRLAKIRELMAAGRLDDDLRMHSAPAVVGRP